MGEFGFDWDDLQTARAHRDDPYVSYKEVIVQLPDIAAYRAAVDKKLTAHGPSKFDALIMQPCASSAVEMGSLAD